MKYHKWSGLNNRFFFFVSQSGSQKSKVKIVDRAGPPLKAPGKGLSGPLSWLLVVPRLVRA